ncbi:MAG TPA: hypothetical protein VFO33_06185, partial [Casimicrobiaceae bacterium]|nr:hypothetical protein [Casimicrobiaceae bacterium]
MTLPGPPAGGATFTREEIQTLATAGIQAPSADNRHGVRFEATADAIYVVATAESLQPMPEHRRAFLEFSVGAIAENMRLEAARLSLSCNVQTSNAWPHDGRMATLQLVARDGGKPEPIGEALFDRHTNRRLYRRARVPPPDLARLASAIDTPGVAVRWLDHPDERRIALRLIRIAEAERFRRPKLHRELFDAIRFDVGWEASCESGLPPGALEVEPPLRGAFRMLRHWPLQRVLNAAGAA